ncbi:type I pullulanase [Caloranaerobacter azorensis]|uniref:pullulanase n=1 Tax=Caloranaerobacter azorensis TaxID=116090 RepID=A0A6P1YDP8_9FIRM|nr:type I pullulanase [Caloranaerobacter azorensis]QIB27254.1 type I pullulanase [Caloranaerobacter azorensis]
MKMRKLSLFLVIVMLMQVFVGCADQNSKDVSKDLKSEEKKGSKLIIHYHRYEGDYDNWSFWIWPYGKEGKAYHFTGEDEFGKILEVQFDEKLDKVGVIPRLGNWEKKDIDMDRFIELNGDVTEVWMLEGVEKIYYDKSEVSTRPKILGAFLDSKNEIVVEFTNFVNLTGENNEGFIIKSGDKELEIREVEAIKVKRENSRKYGFETIMNDTKVKFIYSPDIIGYTPKDDENVYVIGDFNNYDIDEKFEMKFNDTFNIYELIADIGEKTGIKYGQHFTFAVASKKDITFKYKDKFVLDKYIGKSAKLFKILLRDDVDISKNITVYHKDFKERDVEMRKVLESEEFVYDGDDLGATYTKEYTVFKVWSPVAESMKVVIYDDYKDSVGKVYPMSKGEKGVWELKLYGDYKNKYYNYRVTINGVEKETPDPYAKGATVNGKMGMIVDFDSINPEGWDEHEIPAPIKPTEAVIYEMHVRDFSVDEDSGIKHKGKYLAFTEKGTKGPNGEVTGLDYLKELGITHIHLLPVYDFASVDETKEGEYNWGYDPYLYNVPEGSYSTNPYDGTVRIKEFKEMVKALHENGIRVVMDVVFNHTYTTGNSPFDILVPKYYYRTDSSGKYTNGSGCGNETASEKPMMRKFIVDSVKFWATEYKIDGFRFDLMALHDIDTMREVEKQLRKINPNILIYGEPWTGGPSSLSPTKQLRKGKQKGMDIAVFNDDFRNAIKGDNDGEGVGFVNGGAGLENEIKKGIVGMIDYSSRIKGFTKEPTETINYVSCHDNLCLFDKFEKSNPNATSEEREKMNRLALSMVLTSQGIPFIQGGTEILRTKYGNHNSFRAGDEINKIDWSNKNKYRETYEYIKGLIALRKSQKVMTLDKAEDIKKYLKFIEAPKNSVAYLLTSPYEGDFKNILIIHNANREEIEIKLPLEGKWSIIANEKEVNLDGVSGAYEAVESVKVAPLSTYILIKTN